MSRSLWASLQAPPALKTGLDLNHQDLNLFEHLGSSTIRKYLAGSKLYSCIALVHSGSHARGLERGKSPCSMDHESRVSLAGLSLPLLKSYQDLTVLRDSRGLYSRRPALCKLHYLNLHACCGFGEGSPHERNICMGIYPFRWQPAPSPTAKPH